MGAVLYFRVLNLIPSREDSLENEIKDWSVMRKLGPERERGSRMIK